MKTQSSIPESSGVDTGYPDIDSLGEHVLAVKSHPRVSRAGAQEIVAPWGTVTADDVDDTIRVAQLDHQVVKQIELTGVIMASSLGPMIPKKVIKPGHGIWEVTIADPVHDVNVFACM